MAKTVGKHGGGPSTSRSAREMGGPPPCLPLDADQISRFVVDVLGNPVGDGSRARGAHEMPVAPGGARVPVLLDRRLVVLVGVHLREVVPTDDFRQAYDQGFRIVAQVKVLL